MKVRLAA